MSTWLKMDEEHIREALRQGGLPEPGPALIAELKRAVDKFARQRGFEAQIENFIEAKIAGIKAVGPRLQHRRAVIRIETLRTDDGWTATTTVEGDGAPRAKLETTEPHSTGQRAELEGLLQALLTLNARESIEIVVECPYLEAAINNDWPERWAKSNWTGRNGEQIKNVDIWKRVAEALAKTQPAQVSARTQPERQRAL